MSDPIREVLAGARLARNEGRIEDALLGYRRAAELARDDRDETLLAHALRHVSDVAREIGNPELALSAGAEAVRLFRASPNVPHLDLANALRVTALAWQSLGAPADAVPLWTQARELYALANVRAGVQECEENLPGPPGRRS